jgi:hypothetical protein
MTKFKGTPNIERVRADRETRRSNAAVPQESKNKRLRTKERIIKAELKKDES